MNKLSKLIFLFIYLLTYLFSTNLSAMILTSFSDSECEKRIIFGNTTNVDWGNIRFGVLFENSNKFISVKLPQLEINKYDLCFNAINTGTNLGIFGLPRIPEYFLELELINSNGVKVPYTTEGIKLGKFLPSKAVRKIIRNPLLYCMTFLSLEPDYICILSEYSFYREWFRCFDIKNPGVYTLRISINGFVSDKNNKYKPVKLPPVEIPVHINYTGTDKKVNIPYYLMKLRGESPFFSKILALRVYIISGFTTLLIAMIYEKFKNFFMSLNNKSILYLSEINRVKTTYLVLISGVIIFLIPYLLPFIFDIKLIDNKFLIESIDKRPMVYYIDPIKTILRIKPVQEIILITILIFLANLKKFKHSIYYSLMLVILYPVIRMLLYYILIKLGLTSPGNLQVYIPKITGTYVNPVTLAVVRFSIEAFNESISYYILLLPLGVVSTLLSIITKWFFKKLKNKLIPLEPKPEPLQ